MRKRQSCLFVRNFIQCLYVIYPRKIYVSTRKKFATVEIYTLYVIRCKSVSLTLKQAKRASMRYRKVTKRGYVVELKAPCKRTQHCWPTTPNIVGCYMLRPFAHPRCMLLGVVASACTPLPTRTQQLPTLLAQQCRELLRPRAKQSRTTTQSSSAFKLQDGDYTRENS